jgi:serine/threonine protein kinase
LEFCTVEFSSRKKYGSLPTWTVAEISRLRKAEADIVEEKSHLDQLRLYEDARALLTQPRKPGIADEQQVMFLLQRLRGGGLHLSADSPESNHSSRLEKISISSLRKVQVLGTGSFGDVHKANWLGIEVARKTFHGPSAADFEREVEILEGLSHPNIVSLLWHGRDERKCHMIMELMDGDLYSLMQERLEECGSNGPPFSISEAVHIMLQVAEGMLFLHEKKIVHRDLKSRNILIKHMKATEVRIKYVHAKVADFGLSRTKEKSMTYSNQTQNQGTTKWMAPEMLKDRNEDDEVEVEGEEVKSYPFKVDVYSFGMVCFEILSGDVPFSSSTPKEVRRMVLGGERPQLPDVCPERLRCLIEACWRSEPNERPRFGDICAELRDLTCAHYMTCNCLNFKPSSLFCPY